MILGLLAIIGTSTGWSAQERVTVRIPGNSPEQNAQLEEYFNNPWRVCLRRFTEQSLRDRMPEETFGNAILHQVCKSEEAAMLAGVPEEREQRRIAQAEAFSERHYMNRRYHQKAQELDIPRW